MRTLKVCNLELSRIGLGGGKFVGMEVEKCRLLVDKALSLGINVLDGHHRYGNAEKVFSFYPNAVKMTKVSAYKIDTYRELVETSKEILKNIDIMWVSDLDDTVLYDYGERIYNKLKVSFPLLGVTTESPFLAFKFMNAHPECKFFMIPIYLGMNLYMNDFIQYAKLKGKIVFGIKSTLDGVLLKKHSIEDCCNFVKKVDPSVILVGTTKVSHLEELVRIYEKELGCD